MSNFTQQLSMNPARGKRIRKDLRTDSWFNDRHRESREG
jgi:hypothetical protein